MPLIVLLLLLIAAPTHANPLVLHMATDGNDANDGSITAPIQSLTRAHALVQALVPLKDQDVEIHIQPGVYQDQHVTWTWTMPTHTITFRPSNNNRPTFDGSGLTTPNLAWFRLSSAKGEATHLVFYRIRVRHYATAISLEGDRNNPLSGFNGFNTIEDCIFEDIGEPTSFAAVRLLHSQDNLVTGNIFRRITNEQPTCHLLHAIYAAHMASRNLIMDNEFRVGCGDPVRIRDFSNENAITDNLFTNIGVNAAYTDWYCIGEACTKPTPECPSWENDFFDNTIKNNYAGSPLGETQLFQPDETPGCTPLFPGAVRVYASGNH